MGKYLNEKALFYRVLKRFNYCSSPSKRAAFYLDFHFTASLMPPGKGEQFYNEFPHKNLNGT